MGVRAWGLNAKVLVSTEILNVPMSWIFFYRTIFMRNLGMGEVFIGYAVMLPIVLQMLLPTLGGYFADRFGRKRVYLLFDIGWIASMAVWSMATDPWHAILALFLQGLTTTTFGIWETLLIEDTESQYRAGIYSLVQSNYIFRGLLTPVAGTLVFLYGVDQGCRYMFLMALITFTVAFIIRSAYLRESEIGKTLLTLERDRPERPKGYIETSRMIFKHRRLLVLLVLSVLGSMTLPLISTYQPLYLSDSRALALDESAISLIPMASSIPSLIALSFFIPKLKQNHIRKALLVGYVCGIFSSAILITAPRGALVIAILSSVLDSARSIAIFSILKAFLVNTIDEVNPLAKAKIMSLVTMYSAFASWPAPVIGGYLYTVSPAWPFILIILLLTGSLSLMSKI
jgi:MFS family permease